MLQLGERFTDEEFQDIMRDGNFERNGKIWIDEFVASVQSK
jgi:Ca2+-binding EF-hand superfamily protein